MVSQLPDKQIIELVKNGDKSAFDLLVSKYQFRILKLVNRYVRDSSEAMDVSQEAFIKAYKAIHNFRGESAFYTWLCRIAINSAKNYLVNRKKRLMEINIEMENYEIPITRWGLREFATPERMMVKDEIEKIVISTINNLPEELQTAIKLREIQGLTYEEIAGVMACPVGTVRSRIFRAREAIERKIKPIYDINGGDTHNEG